MKHVKNTYHSIVVNTTRVVNEKIVEFLLNKFQESFNKILKNFIKSM